MSANIPQYPVPVLKHDVSADSAKPFCTPIWANLERHGHSGAKNRHAGLPAGISAILLCLLLWCGFTLQTSAAVVLPAPSSVRVTVDTWNRFSLSWSSVTGATGYLVQRRDDDASTWKTVSVLDSTTLSLYDVVQNGHVYTYRVHALQNGVTGLEKETGEAAMLWPTALSILPVAADKMAISWTLPTNAFLPDAGYVPVIERRQLVGNTYESWTYAGRAEVGAPSFTDTGLKAGERYEYRVRFDTGLGGTDLWYPTSTGIEGWTKLPAPTNLSATLSPYGSTLLAWTPAPNIPSSDALGYVYTQIERSTDGGPFTQLTTLDAVIATWTDTGIFNGHVYRYRVRHIRSGATGDWSDEGRILFLYPQTLSAEAVYADQVNLVWTWPSAEVTVLGEARPRIERRKSGETVWTEAALLEAGVTAYRDQALSPDTVYYYRIQAQYGDGTVSPWYPASGGGREVRTGIDFKVSFTGHALSPTMVRLEWDYAALEGKTVRLERFNTAGEPETILQTASEGSYIDTGLLEGTEYRWQLVVLAPSGTSTATSDILTLKTETAPTPMNVKAVAAAADRVVITWDYAYGLESGFEIWRKTGGTWSLVGETLRNIQYWTDTALPEAGTAQWKVRAVRGDAVFSAFAETDTRRLDMPVLPTAFNALLQLGRMTLSWSAALPDYGTDAVYTVETRPGLNDAWSDVTQVAAGSTSVTWFLMDHGERDFRIRADVQGLPTYSGLYHYTGAAPAAPAGLQAAQVGSRQVTLTWQQASEALSGYRLYRTENGTRMLLGTLSGLADRYEDTAIKAGTALSYTLQSWNAYTTSPETTIGPVTIPATLTFSDLGAYGWAAPSINRLASLGIVSGVAPGRYAPAQGLTRAEYMKMLLGALGISPADRPTGPVADVPAGAWYAGWMYAAWEEGILTPDNAGKLYPTKAMTRAEMADATLRACLVAGKELMGTDVAVLDKFVDNLDIPDAYRGAFAMMVGNGLISGRSGTTLAPVSGLTRAEAAVMVNRLLLLP